MKYILAICLLAPAFWLSAQNNPYDPQYIKATDIALGELQKGQCKPCLEAYERAFAISQHSVLSHLRAARCAQMCHDVAKAQAYADKAVEISWDITADMLKSADTYPELTYLRQSDLGKKTLENTALAAKQTGFNPALAEAVDALKADDQKYRLMKKEYRAKYAQDSPEYKQFMSDWAQNDSICVVRAEAILAQYGYPGKSLVGQLRQDALWLVIQHAPLEKQEKYFPLLDEAAQKGEMSKSSWALTVDRIRMFKGQAQVYGSQVVPDETTGGSKFYNIEDEAHVNKRRAEVGLEPLEAYAKRFGIEWSPKK